MRKIKIKFGWCNLDEVYLWLNNVNNSFFRVNKLELYENDNIEITTLAKFIPWKILILLGYFLDSLNSKSKNISFEWQKDLLEFLQKSWIINFINHQKVNYNFLADSVIIPFCKVSTVDDLQYHLTILFEKAWLSENIKRNIAYSLSELHNNSINHWKTNNIYIIWQSYPKVGKYDITIYDDWKWITTDDFELIEAVYHDFIEEEFKNELVKKYWFNLFFIILCVTTKFSTKWKNVWWLGLYDLSSFLLKNNWYLNIATWEEFVNLKFKKESDILCKDSINIDCKKMDNKINWTYISFTFSK